MIESTRGQLLVSNKEILHCNKGLSNCKGEVEVTIKDNFGPLFVYVKGKEEVQILGSIVLESYNISIRKLDHQGKLRRVFILRVVSEEDISISYNDGVVIFCADCEKASWREAVGLYHDKEKKEINTISDHIVNAVQRNSVCCDTISKTKK